MIDEAIEVQRLNLGPGDILVLKTSVRLSEKTIEQIRCLVRSQFPDNLVMVVQDMDLYVLSPKQ